MKPSFITNDLKKEILLEWKMFCEDENTFRAKGDEYYIETVDDTLRFSEYLLNHEKNSKELTAFYILAEIVMRDFSMDAKIADCIYLEEIEKEDSLEWTTVYEHNKGEKL